MSPAELLIVALLGLWQHIPARACIEHNRGLIAQRLEASEAQHGVPPSLMLTIAFYETHVGCDAGEGGNWGAPRSRTQRHLPGTPLQAARALAWSYRVCGDWRGAVARFHSGLCRPWQARHRAYVIRISGTLLRLHAQTGEPLPEGFAGPR